MDFSDFEEFVKKELEKQAKREGEEDSDATRRELPKYLLAGLTGTERFGPFELRSQLGAGGFGVVFLARDSRTGRTVALKLPLPQVILDSTLKKLFVRDAKAGLLLDHPGIVKVHEFDEIDGIPYIASEYVEGPTLERWLSKRGTISFDDTVDLVIWIADAIDHAHKRGVVHRDLKPANILLRTVVVESATVIHPMITDFGLARVRDGLGLTATKTGTMIGSMPYMAPEQIKAAKDSVGPYSDVYSLGVILYRMLTGSMPFSEASSQPALMYKILHDQPVSVSTRRPVVPADLQTICEKCLRKRPHQRFASAADLRDELKRYQDGQPIKTLPLSLWEKAGEWCRRNPAPMVAMLASVVIIILQAFQLRESQRVNTELRRVNADLTKAKAQADANLTLANDRNRVVQRYYYDRRLLDAQAAMAEHDVLLAQQILTEIDPGEAGREFVWNYLWRKSREKMEFIPRKKQTSDINRIWNLGNARWLVAANSFAKMHIFDTTDWSLAGEIDYSAYPRGNIHYVSLSLDGQRIYVTHQDITPKGMSTRGGLRVLAWDTVERRTLVHSIAPPVANISGLKLFPDSDTLLVWGRRERGAIALHEHDLAKRNSKERVLGHDYGTIAFSKDGMKFVGAHLNGNLYLVDAHDPGIRKELKYTGEPDRTTMTFHDENGLILMKSVDRVDGQDVPRILGWKSSFEGSGEPVLAHALPYDPDFDFWPVRAKNLVLVGKPNEVAGILGGIVGLLDLESGKSTPLELDRADPGFGKKFTIQSMESFVHDGTLLTPVYQEGFDWRWRAWDLKSTKQLIDLSIRDAFTPFESAGRDFLYGVDDKDKLFRWRSKREFRIPEKLAELDDEAWCAAFTPDSARIVTGSDDKDDAPTLKAWDRATGRMLWAVKAHDATVSVMAMHPGGKIVATGALDDSANVRLWDMATGQMTADLKGLDLNVRALRFSPDGTRLAAGDKKGRCVVWDVATGKVVHVFPAGIDRVLCLAFSDNGQTLLTSTEDGWIRTWNLADRSKLREFYTGFLTQGLTIDPDLKTAAGIGKDGRLFVVDFETGEDLRHFEMPGMKPLTVMLFPDGKTLAAGDKAGNLMMWDLETGTEKFRVKAHEAQINALTLSPDGKTLVSCAHDGTVRLWHAGPEF